MITDTIILPDDFSGHDVSTVSIPSYYEGDLAYILISKNSIDDRIDSLAKCIHERLGDKALIVLCVLNGAFRFYASLVDKLSELRRADDAKHIRPYQPIRYDFIRLKSYADDKSTGEVRVTGATLEHIKQKHVLIVEDIFDTGLTMRKMLSVLAEHKPASVQVVTLLVKRTDRRIKADQAIDGKDHTEYRPEFVGFEIPDRFVIGFGLDFNEAFRDLDHIGVISESGMQKYKQ